MTQFAESVVEDAALDWLESLCYAVLHGSDIAIGCSVNQLTRSTSPAPARASARASMRFPANSWIVLQNRRALSDSTLKLS